MTTLTDQLAALASMTPAQLRAEWRRVYRAAVPALPVDLLRRGVAYRLQERVHGGLAPPVSRALDRAARQLAHGDPGAVAAPMLRPGTRLVRQWHDTTYSVLVADDGFLLGDQRYASLSQVARAITGTPWSGPRFFGLPPGGGTTGAAAASAARSRAARAASAARAELAEGVMPAGAAS